MACHAVIMSPKGDARLNMQAMCFFCRDALLDVIQKLRAMLGTQEVGALPGKVAHLQRSCTALPRLEHFVSDVCEVGISSSGGTCMPPACQLSLF